MSANMNVNTGGGKSDVSTDACCAGLLAGNQVLTMNGYCPIEELSVGDRVITRRGARILREITVSTRKMRPIKVGPHTLGFSRPGAEMLMAPSQEVMVRDWRAEMLFGQDFVIMPINRMVDGKYIAELAEEGEHTAYALRFDEEEIYYADGVEVVSEMVLTKSNSPDVPAAA